MVEVDGCPEPDLCDTVQDEVSDPAFAIGMSFVLVGEFTLLC